MEGMIDSRLVSLLSVTYILQLPGNCNSLQSCIKSVILLVRIQNISIYHFIVSYFTVITKNIHLKK